MSRNPNKGLRSWHGSPPTPQHAGPRNGKGACDRSVIVAASAFLALPAGALLPFAHWIGVI